jgi:hypothetical protein
MAGCLAGWIGVMCMLHVLVPDLGTLQSSVADPDRFGPDPDPTSENRPDPDPDSSK